MNQMLGMDIDAGRQLASAFVKESTRLDHISTEIERSLCSVSWGGQDAAEFRQIWNGSLRSKLLDSARALREAAQTVQRQTDEQERASGSESSTGFRTSPRKSAGETPDPKKTAASLFSKSVNASTVIDWFGKNITGGAVGVYQNLSQRVTATQTAIERAVDPHLVFLQQTFVIPKLTGRPPQLAEIGAGLIIIAASDAGVIMNALKGTDQHFFDDGKPWSGDPHYTTPRSPAPSNFTDLTRTTMDAYNNGRDSDHGEVQVTAIRNPGQPTRYIVSIPGTQADIASIGGWSGTSTKANDWQANVYAVANGRSSYGDAAMQAIDKAIALDRANHPNETGPANILLTGHSQGGLTVANIAASPQFRSRYNVDAVVTYGSPVDCANVPNNIPILSVENGTGYGSGRHTGDVIPRLDLGGVATGPDGNVTRINNPPIANNPWDIRSNHEQSGYIKSASEMQQAQPNTPLAENKAKFQTWSDNNGLQQYYLANGGASQTIQVPVGRKLS